MSAKNWIAVWSIITIGFTWSAFAQCTTSPRFLAPAAHEPGFLTNMPEIRSELLQWENAAPRNVQVEIQTVRTGDAAEKALAAMRLGKMGENAKGASLALLEAFADTRGLIWKQSVAGGPQTSVPGTDETSPGSEAAEAIARIGGKSVVEPLILALNKSTSDWGRRQNAALALGEIGDKTAVEPLAQLLKRTPKDRNSTPIYLKNYIAEALGRIGDKSAIEPLIDAMKDIDPGLHYWAVEALGMIGDKSAVPALIMDLRPGSNVREQAADALGEIGDKAALAPLIQALMDRDGIVGICVTRALAKIGDKAAVEPLIQALRDDHYRNSGAGEAAGDALKRITGQEFGTNHRAWAQWWEVNGTSFLVHKRIELDASQSSPDRAHRRFYQQPSCHVDM